MISLEPLSTGQFLALPEREQGLQAIGDQIAFWLKWVTREREAEGLATTPDTNVMLNGYDGAPPCWPSVGQLTNWLKVIRAGVENGEGKA